MSYYKLHLVVTDLYDDDDYDDDDGTTMQCYCCCCCCCCCCQRWRDDGEGRQQKQSSSTNYKQCHFCATQAHTPHCLGLQANGYGVETSINMWIKMLMMMMMLLLLLNKQTMSIILRKIAWWLRMATRLDHSSQGWKNWYYTCSPLEKGWQKYPKTTCSLLLWCVTSCVASSKVVVVVVGSRVVAVSCG
jgi:hypothetical protein